MQIFHKLSREGFKLGLLDDVLRVRADRIDVPWLFSIPLISEQLTDWCHKQLSTYLCFCVVTLNN